MLLSNITAQSSPCANLLKLEVDIIPLEGATVKYYPVQSRCNTSPSPTPYPEGKPQKARALNLLVDAFASSASLDTHSSERKGQLHFLAGVFANISGVSLRKISKPRNDQEYSKQKDDDSSCHRI